MFLIFSIVYKIQSKLTKTRFTPLNCSFFLFNCWFGVNFESDISCPVSTAQSRWMRYSKGITEDSFTTSSPETWSWEKFPKFSISGAVNDTACRLIGWLFDITLKRDSDGVTHLAEQCFDAMDRPRFGYSNKLMSLSYYIDIKVLEGQWLMAFNHNNEPARLTLWKKSGKNLHSPEQKNEERKFRSAETRQPAVSS